jgi:hypothetical protein
VDAAAVWFRSSCIPNGQIESDKNEHERSLPFDITGEVKQQRRDLLNVTVGYKYEIMLLLNKLLARK